MGENTPLIVILSAVVIFFAVIFIRALRFKPKKINSVEIPTIPVNGEKATADLAEMIRCKTISHFDASEDDASEFSKFEKLLPKLFPNVFEKCLFEKVGERGILIRWKGENSDNPSVFMSHYDVVNVEQHDWSKPAFDGIIEDGVLWGRGTLDTKGTLNGILQAAESLIIDGFVPKNDVYFAIGGSCQNEIDYAEIKDLPYYVGSVGTSVDEERRAAREMTEYYLQCLIHREKGDLIEFQKEYKGLTGKTEE